MNPMIFFFASGGRAAVSMPVVLFVLFLSGCGDDSRNVPQVKQTVKKFTVATVLEGAVTDDRGPVKAGTVTALGLDGRAIAGTQLQNSDHYRIEIPADTSLPIVLTFHAGAENNSVEEYVAVVVHSNLTQYDINPSSTAIAKKAKELGGYTHANLVRAAESMGTVPDANKTTAGFRGDPTKQYGGWH
ncbi:MAG: hypothetical protein ACU841_10025 [Gammaproteobacteria bacterium]